ncbi:MAG TPA: serine/threonine-protein kinase, partial [Ktedonobacteraceae bacterium]|nr:serine/threonine-protein kinase [Ktedonobacteraceae bacterium]
MVDLEGRTLARYELQQLIGRGGMADVYLAFDPHFERDVAIKVFKRQDEEMLRRFIREARLMASLRHPNLMPIYDAGESSIDRVPQYYIVMPVMPGGTLRARIRRNPLALVQSCQYLREIASALDYIHTQGIVHRDIKSSNVLLDADDRCFLSDFGIAHTASDATQLTSTGNVLGTVDYVAPELFEPHTRANALSDLYSLGILLFEMVTGRLPFTGDTQIAVVAMHVGKRPPLPRTFVPDLPPQVERVMLRALEKDPALRYQSASELADAFCSAVSAPRELDAFASS